MTKANLQTTVLLLCAPSSAELQARCTACRHAWAQMGLLRADDTSKATLSTDSCTHVMDTCDGLSRILMSPQVIPKQPGPTTPLTMSSAPATVTKRTATFSTAAEEVSLEFDVYSNSFRVPMTASNVTLSASQLRLELPQWEWNRLRERVQQLCTTANNIWVDNRLAMHHWKKNCNRKFLLRHSLRFSLTLLSPFSLGLCNTLQITLVALENL